VPDQPRRYRSAARRVIVASRPLLPALAERRRRLARELFISRLKGTALAVGAHLEVDVADDVDLGRRLSLEIWSGTWNVVRLGSGVTIGDGVRLSLRGGTFDVGTGTEIRRLGTYQVGGRVVIGSGVVMSTGLVLHCADSVTVDDLSIIGEYTTIADSAHLRTPPGVPVHHSTRTAPVHIGSNVWIGAHVVVAAGVSIGSQAFVGAAAVVTDDIPAGWLAVGIPARPVRALDLEQQ
jgi:acetyltransferase-like isoleucine patch superfamily enzyme